MLDHIVIDTNTMPFEDEPGHPEKKVQTLLPPDELAGGVVRLSYWPPGFTQQIRKLIATEGHRHYHRTVTERHYILSGDHTIYHWPTRTAPPMRTRLYRHYYLENPPMTQHGITLKDAPVTGNKLLVWTDGPGSTSLYEPESEQETIRVDFEGESPSEAVNAPILFNAEDIRWTPHPHQRGWLIKPLSDPKSTLPAVTLVNIPLGSRGQIGGLTPSGDVKHWLYVLTGDVSLKAVSHRGEFPVALKEGGFLAWNEACGVFGAEGPLTEGGCVILCVGHMLGPRAERNAS